MNYQAWLAEVPETITADSLWKMQVYRFALFLSDVAWQDTSKLVRDQRTLRLADQLYNAVGSIGANIAEGYSRGTGKDRARFYEYALGSARESRDWYFKGRHVLSDEVTLHRLHMLTEVIRLLLVMVPQQRNSQIREDHQSMMYLHLPNQMPAGKCIWMLRSYYRLYLFLNNHAALCASRLTLYV